MRPSSSSSTIASKVALVGLTSVEDGAAILSKLNLLIDVDAIDAGDEAFSDGDREAGLKCPKRSSGLLLSLVGVHVGLLSDDDVPMRSHSSNCSLGREQ